MNARPWVYSLYAVGLLLIIQPLAEALAFAWPVRFGEVGWRFGMVGSFFTLLGTFIVGVALVLLTGYLLGHRRVVRVGGIVAIVLGAMLIVASASFALDWVQLRMIIRTDLKGGFDITGAKAIIGGVLGTTAFVLLGYAAIRASRRPASARDARKATRGEGLVVGQGQEPGTTGH